MGQSAINAMTGLFLYYKIPAINIGVTISIGRNDVASSVVTAADLAVISKHMNTYKGAAVHIANLDRDRNCRAGEAPATCSGASLGPFGFTNAFASGLLNDGLNPCALSNGGCAPDATCTYSAVYGLTVCACKAGFVGNGYACDKSELASLGSLGRGSLDRQINDSCHSTTAIHRVVGQTLELVISRRRPHPSPLHAAAARSRRAGRGPRTRARAQGPAPAPCRPQCPDARPPLPTPARPPAAVRACNPLSLTSCPATDCLYQSLCPVTSTCSLALPINEGKACNSGAGTCRSGACAPNAA